MKKLKNRFKNIKPQTLLTHVIVTLLYPLARVVMASSRRLLFRERLPKKHAYTAEQRDAEQNGENGG